MAQVLKLNKYLKEFLAVNGVKETPLNEAEVVEILEYGVPATYHREFTRQGFDPLTQGLQKFLEFCSRLKACKLTMTLISKKVAFSEDTVNDARKKKAKAVKTEKSLSRICMQYCELHGTNPMHSTTNCFDLKR